MEGSVKVIEEFAAAPTEAIVQAMIDRASAFSKNKLSDDIAVVAARFPQHAVLVFNELIGNVLRHADAWN
jgi:signal transduction histidine kinase